MSAVEAVSRRPPQAGGQVRYAFRLAGRELRGGARGFGVFLACLVVGVAAIAGVGSLAASLAAGLRGDARTLLGGDVAARIGYRPASEAEREFLGHSGAVSQTTVMRAMAATVDGAYTSLIELKAVDSAYPLYGGVALQPAQPLAGALERRDGRFGAAVDPAMLARLGIAVGGDIKIGDAVFQVRAAVASEPDARMVGLELGPRVMVSSAALAETGLLQPGALVTYDYRVRLPPRADAGAWVRQAEAAFPDAGWRLRTYNDASPGVRRFIDRMGLFLNLVGVTALLVGGVGIGNAVGGFIAGRTATIATLKSLGASVRLVFSVYFIEVMALALCGIAIALVLGALLPVAAAPLLATSLPVPLRVGLYSAPLGVAALFGILTTLAFTLLPLSAIGRVSAAGLFHETVEPVRGRRVARWAVFGTAAAAAALAGLTVASASDRRVALWYILGAAVAFALFRGAGWLTMAAARTAGRPHYPPLRLALANLHRPGAPTARIVLSLGIGLTLLVALALVEGNLAREVDTRVAQGAPAFFFIDIQRDQLGAFAEVVNATPGARFEQVPMLRGRIVQLNGVPVEQAAVAPDAQWAVRGDRGLTYSATPPAGAQIVAGQWWPADYHGPPLISFDAALARGMGLKIGDTLTVKVLGREITARIANLRSIEWARLGINFAIVFAPGTFEAAPHTNLAAVYLPPSEEDALVGRMTKALPNVSAIGVREALAQVTRIIATIGAALRLTALVTLVVGALVLGGAIAAGHRRRVYDAVVLKVLGATRPTIAATFLIEHALLGLVSAAIAAVFGTAAAYFLVTGPLRSEWVFLPGPLLGVLLIATTMTLGMGFAGTWRALSATAAPLLRNQ